MKCDLAWIRSKPLSPVTNTQVPASSYAAINAERFVVREFHLPEPAPAPAATTPTAAAKPAFKPGGKPAFKPGGARFKPGAARSKPETGNSAKDGNERSEEHTSELQSLMRISYAVFCLNTKRINYKQLTHTN